MAYFYDRRVIACLLGIGAVTCAVYLPGLQGGFLFDDAANITRNRPLHITQFNGTQLAAAALSSDAGPLKRPLAMASFALNHLATGINPYYFKLTNLIIHLLVGGSFFLLTHLLMSIVQRRYQPLLSRRRIQWISLAVSAGWLLHPFNLTSVLYVVQRMNSLGALFTVWGLIFYCLGRMRLGFQAFPAATQAGPSARRSFRAGVMLMLTGIVLFGSLAVLCKENGVLLVWFIAVTEWVLFGFQAPDPRRRCWIYGICICCVLLPVIGALYYFGLDWNNLIQAYANRGFSLSERVLTEGRVLCFYFLMLVRPNLARMGLFHDDFMLSSDLLHPFATLPALLGVLVFSIIAVWLRRRAPLLSYGILFYLVGHSLESTLLPLEIIHEHRNYLPSYGVLLCLFYYCLHPAIKKPCTRGLLACTACIMLVLFTLTTAIRAEYWSSNLKLALVNVRDHPASARSNMLAGEVLLNAALSGRRTTVDGSSRQLLAKARDYFQAAERNGGENLSGGFALLLLDDKQRRPLDAGLLMQLTRRLESGTLPPANITALLQLNRCQQRAACHLPPHVLDALLSALLNNPALTGKLRANVLMAAIPYYLSQHDAETALHFAEQAVRYHGSDPQTHLYHAALLIRFGDFQRAREQLDRIQRMPLPFYTAEQIKPRVLKLEQLMPAKSVLPDP